MVKMGQGDLGRVPFRVQIIVDIIKRLDAVKILDVGCGWGELDEAILRKIPSLEFTCTDMDAQSVEETELRLKRFNVTCVTTDFLKFDVDQKWDLCMFNGLLEHVSHPVRVLKKASGLAPYIFAIVPNALSLHRIIGVELDLISHIRQLTEVDLSIHHKRNYTPSLLLKHFEMANLNVIATGGIMLKPLSDGQMLKWSKRTNNLFFELGKKLPTYCAEIYVLAKSPEQCYSITSPFKALPLHPPHPLPQVSSGCLSRATGIP